MICRYFGISLAMLLLVCLSAICITAFGLTEERHIIATAHPEFVTYSEAIGPLRYILPKNMGIVLVSRYCSHVREVTLSQDISLSALRRLAGLNGLEHLSMVRAKITKEHIAALGGCPALQSLSLLECELADDSLEELGQCTHLRRLVIAGETVTNNAVENTCPPSSLVDVEFWSRTASTHAFAHGIPAWISSLPNLMRVAIHLRGAGDDAVAHLAAEYEAGRLQQLKCLDLRGSSVSDSGVECVLRISSLTTVDVVDSGVTRRGQAELVRRFGDGNVEWDELLVNLP